MPELPAKIFDLPREKFPIVMEFSHPKTGKIVHAIRVEAPESPERKRVFVPPLAQQFGHAVALKITFGDGQIVEMPAP